MSRGADRFQMLDGDARSGRPPHRILGSPPWELSPGDRSTDQDIAANHDGERVFRSRVSGEVDDDGGLPWVSCFIIAYLLLTGDREKNSFLSSATWPHVVSEDSDLRATAEKAARMHM